MLVVKYAFSMVKQYAWVLNMRMHDLSLQSFDFFTICAGVFDAVFILLRNKCKFPPQVKNHFYGITLRL